MPPTSIADLLKDLGSKEPEEAWVEFLNDYSSLVYQVIRRFEADVDNAADCFQFVCERLIENRSKRLRQFKTDGSALFTTWLRAVVRNLCIDWHRKKFGRQRLFASLSGMTAFDQSVFKLVYERSVPLDEALTILSSDFPNVTETRLAQSSERIETLLTPNQRWILSQHSIHGVSSDDEQFETLVANLPDQQPNPEAQAILNERKRRLVRAVADLSDQDRLLIRLRFEEGLTLEQAARLLGLGNAQRADRQIKEILAKLREVMGSK